MSYYDAKTDCVLSNLSVAQLGEFQDEAATIDDWRTCDEIDAELRSRSSGLTVCPYCDQLVGCEAIQYGSERLHPACYEALGRDLAED